VSLAVVVATTLATVVFFVVAVGRRCGRFASNLFQPPAHRRRGRVCQAGDAPVGTVQVKSELWTAVSDERWPPAKKSSSGVEGLRLRVCAS